MRFPWKKPIKASLTVEAALLFPLVTVLMALLLGVLRAVLGWYMLQSAVIDTADTMANYACLYELLELSELSEAAEEETDLTDLDTWLKQKAYEASLNALGAELARHLLESHWEDLDLAQWGVSGGVEGLDFSGTRIFYSDGTQTALMKVKVSYRPFCLFENSSFISWKRISVEAVVHPFIGKDPFQTSSTEESDKVYRIGAGEKYHVLTCYLIHKDVEELTLLAAQQQGYAACKRCKPWESSRVYVTKGGECYHTKECTYLYPSLTEMTEEEAEEAGLLPCQICIGGGDWFDGNE